MASLPLMSWRTTRVDQAFVDERLQPGGGFMRATVSRAARPGSPGARCEAAASPCAVLRLPGDAVPGIEGAAHRSARGGLVRTAPARRGAGAAAPRVAHRRRCGRGRRFGSAGGRPGRGGLPGRGRASWPPASRALPCPFVFSCFDDAFCARLSRCFRSRLRLGHRGQRPGSGRGWGLGQCTTPWRRSGTEPGPSPSEPEKDQPEAAPRRPRLRIAVLSWPRPRPFSPLFFFFFRRLCRRTRSRCH